MTSVGIMASGVQTSAALPIPATGLQLWVDADDATTFTFSSGAIVSQWNDKSGNNRHLSQSTVANQPSRITAAQNGRAAIRYDGSNDHVRTPTTPVSSAVDNLTMIIACKRTGGGSQSVVFHNGAPNSNGYGLALRANGANIGVLQAAVGWFASTTPDPAAPGVLVLQRSAGTWSMWLNGTNAGLTATFTPSTPTAATEITSDSHLFGGDVYEAMFYDRVLTTTERQQVESYLKTKWGTP